MKKILSLLLCLCIMCGMVLSVSAVTYQSDEAQLVPALEIAEGFETVVSKDMTTGEITYSNIDFEENDADFSSGVSEAHTEGWFPTTAISVDSNGISNTVAPNSIIGSDGRVEVSDTEVMPYSAICYIEIDWPDGSTGLGTAWMIYKDLAVTAGHCMYSSANGGWAESIKIWPGKDGYGFWNNPYGTAKSSALHTASQWVESEDWEYDWGIIELDENIGEDTGWFGIGWSSNDMTGTNVTISGYPGEERYHQYKMSGKITKSEALKIYYNTIDTTGGQSGSPIYTSDNIAYGIHCYGSSTENSGTRITEWRYNYFTSLMD
ncbi:MAG: trypsin-like serine protease [Clostridia bacterium]|nr:trypsin-like serine protease [Clostridia bacterium]